MTKGYTYELMILIGSSVAVVQYLSDLHSKEVNWSKAMWAAECYYHVSAG